MIHAASLGNVQISIVGDLLATEHFIDHRPDGIVIEPTPLEHADEPPASDEDIELAQTNRLFHRQRPRDGGAVGRFINSFHRPTRRFTRDAGLEQIDHRPTRPVLFTLGGRQRFGLRETCIVHIAEARQIIERGIEDRIPILAPSELAAEFHSAVQSRFEEADGRIKTFLFHFAELDLIDLGGGDLLSNTQTEFGDDVQVAAEGERAVEENIPPVGATPLFGNFRDERHNSAQSGVLTSVRHADRASLK